MRKKKEKDEDKEKEKRKRRKLFKHLPNESMAFDSIS